MSRSLMRTIVFVFRKKKKKKKMSLTWFKDIYRLQNEEIQTCNNARAFSAYCDPDAQHHWNAVVKEVPLKTMNKLKTNHNQTEITKQSEITITPVASLRVLLSQAKL
jgi:hypothetical protein